MSKKVIISQSNYVPWKGYFTTMRQATHFIIYDDMQYTKRDWRNRNLFITPNGPKWLSIPVSVSGKFHQKINETVISDPGWSEKHWNFLETNYKKSPYFKEYSSYFRELYKKPPSNLLTDINLIFLKKCVELLEIKIDFLDSRDFILSGDKTEKLVNICKEVGAKEYFTGPAAKNYMDEQKFVENGITVNYYDLSDFPEYKQMWEGFDHHVSILDMFFNLGQDTIKYFN